MEHLQVLLIPPPCAGQVPEVAERGPATLDGGANDVDDGVVDGLGFTGSQRVGPSQRMDLGSPQRLVYVDIPEPGHDGLVQEKWLDQSFAASQLVRKIGGAELGGQG